MPKNTKAAAKTAPAVHVKHGSIKYENDNVDEFAQIAAKAACGQGKNARPGGGYGNEGRPVWAPEFDRIYFKMREAACRAIVSVLTEEAKGGVEVLDDAPKVLNITAPSAVKLK